MSSRVKTPDYYTTLLSRYLFDNLGGIKVFKQEKPSKVMEESYIVVNCLPINYNSVIKEFSMNINIHIPTLNMGLADQRSFNDLTSEICDLIPFERGVEKDGLRLSEESFFISEISAPLKDSDETYFINISVKVYS